MARRVVRDWGASTVGVFLQGGARFAVSVLVGRFAGPAALGALNASLSLATLASLLFPTAAGQAASIMLAREQARGRDDLAWALQRHLSRRAALAGAVALPGVTLYAALGLGAAWRDALWTAALAAAFSAYNLARGLQFGRGQVVRATRWEAMSAGLTLGLLAAVIVADLPGLYLLPLTAGYAAYAVGGWPRTGRPTSPLPDSLRAEADRYVLWGVVGTLASTGLLHASMLFAVATESGEAAGMYAAAISLATPAALLSTAFAMAIAPAMARSAGQSDNQALAAQTDSATRALVAGMVLVFGALAIFATPIVRVVYGPDYGDAVGLLRILLVAVLFSTLPVAATNSITTRGSSGVRLVAAFAVASTAVGLAAMALLGPLFGVTGVAAGFLVGGVAKAVPPVAFVWRRDGHAWVGLTARMLVAVVAAAAVGLLEPLPPLSRAAGGVVFVLAWTLLSAGDLRRGHPRDRDDPSNDGDVDAK